MPIKNRFAELLPEITGWRRDFHEHPELMYDTQRTAGIVAAKLRAFGCDEVVEGLGRTGVVGVIRGRTANSGRTIALRADMDALPIAEDTGLAYASKTDGTMHACGHDGHTAMLLGAAQYLSETRHFDGTVVVIFQPAEEGGGGGLEMIRDGVLERWQVDEVYAMHNWPGMAAGEFAIRPGAFFAATDTFRITLSGKGGHAARPQDAIDPTLMGAQLVLALQSVVSRNADPARQLVVSVTSFETASTAYNVIPPSVTLKGTVRSLQEDHRDLAETRITALAESIATAFGGQATTSYRRGYPTMVNSEAETEYAMAAAQRVAGDCGAAELFMGGEDFAYFLQHRPGAYILLGNGDSAPLHHPQFNFNDDALAAGCSWFAEIAETRLPLA